jgi:xanthine dehydrogenase/oxidase
VFVKRIGGGFGGKQTRPPQMACASALAAHLLNRPVRFVLSMESCLNTAGKRHPCFGKYKVSVNENGKVQTLLNNFITDYGSALNAPAPLVACAFFKSCYAADAWEVNTKAARTNTPSNTWCRAPGITEAM